MQGSLDCLRIALDNGREIYGKSKRYHLIRLPLMPNTGVNTGFGGSANTHTDNVERLQRNLIGFLNCGVTNPSVVANAFTGTGPSGRQTDQIFSTALANEASSATTMPESWVRSTMLVRCNSLASGNSGVRPELLDGLVHLLQNDIIPVIPLRGSISASGDLIPLSYVAGTLQGSPGVHVRIADGVGGRIQLPADVALKRRAQTPLKLGPKEGLAVVNGTAVSAGVGALALHDAHCLAVVAQVLTAMGVEALHGCVESFDPFFSKCRPHAGQAEVARNVRAFLKGSAFVSDSEVDSTEGDCLRQDRYSIRTAPQWLGPTVEDLLLADTQIGVELNSTTDNPIIDAGTDRILHGGNFQAMSVTSAMEKIRKGSQVIGRMLFSQCTELINPALNSGLPPNLTADEPSQDYLLKGVDIMVASLLSELGFLATPVGPHVQNAEMNNQSLNSLAFIAARYTHTALEVLSQLAAAYLLTLCQALDLRALNAHFLAAVEPIFKGAIVDRFNSRLANMESLQDKLWLAFEAQMRKTTGMDSTDRFTHIIQALQPIILAHESSNSSSEAGLLTALKKWTYQCSKLSQQTYYRTRTAYIADPSATPFLGAASKRMYQYVRGPLGVPFMASAICKPGESVASAAGPPGHSTLGDQLGKINVAIRNGALFVPVMECLSEAQAVKARL